MTKQKEILSEQVANGVKPDVNCQFKVGDIVSVNWNDMNWTITKIFEHKSRMRALLEYDYKKQMPIYRAGWNNGVWDNKAYIDGYFPLISKSSSWVDGLSPTLNCS